MYISKIVYFGKQWWLNPSTTPYTIVSPIRTALTITLWVIGQTPKDISA